MTEKIIAKAKWLRSSPRKIQRVMDTIRGMRAEAALTMLSFMPQKGARLLLKVLKSAIANAKNNHKLRPADLFVAEVYANKAVTLKRFRAASRGRGAPIKKRTSHITVCLSSREEN